LHGPAAVTPFPGPLFWKYSPPCGFTLPEMGFTLHQMVFMWPFLPLLSSLTKHNGRSSWIQAIMPIWKLGLPIKLTQILQRIFHNGMLYNMQKVFLSVFGGMFTEC
jgi:hypothetical protein